MMKIAIRVEGNSKVGGGHVYRTLALASMLKDSFEITFYSQDRDGVYSRLIRAQGFGFVFLPAGTCEADEAGLFAGYLDKNTITVIDGYDFNFVYQEIIKISCQKLICIDDPGTGKFAADVIINHNGLLSPVQYEVPLGTRLCLGLQYLMLRPEFFEKTANRTYSKIKEVLVCLGTTDIDGQTLRIAKCLRKVAGESFLLKLIVGAESPLRHYVEDWVKKTAENNVKILNHLSAHELKTEIERSDLMVGTASMISWESCALGTPLVVGIVAENQEKIAEYLEHQGLALNLGQLLIKSDDEIERNFKFIFESSEVRKKMVQLQHKAIDGRSAERIRALFEEGEN